MIFGHVAFKKYLQTHQLSLEGEDVASYCMNMATVYQDDPEARQNRESLREGFVT